MFAGVLLSRSTCPCESMHGHAQTFSEQVIASIIDDSRCGMSDVAFRVAPPIGGPSSLLHLPSFSQRTHRQTVHGLNNVKPKILRVKMRDRETVTIGQYPILETTDSIFMKLRVPEYILTSSQNHELGYSTMSGGFFSNMVKLNEFSTSSFLHFPFCIHTSSPKSTLQTKAYH